MTQITVCEKCFRWCAVEDGGRLCRECSMKGAAR